MSRIYEDQTEFMRRRVPITIYILLRLREGKPNCGGAFRLGWQVSRAGCQPFAGCHRGAFESISMAMDKLDRRA